MNKIKCPLCKEEVSSGLGKGCKMCGMLLQDRGKDFCSKICKTKYYKLNKDNK